MSDIWKDLADPFPPEEVKQRPGGPLWDHKSACPGSQCRETRDDTKHLQFSYIDARAVAQRLDDVVTPAGWEFTCSVIPGSDIVKGRLTIFDGTRYIVREDHGYPNSDRDDEPIKAATSDALKRCAVLFGIGRHLYESRATPVQKAPQRPVAVAPVRSSTDIPDDPYGDDLDFGEVTKPAAKTWVCPIHGTAKTVPAGVSSRTGKPYDAFQSCTERDCNEKPPRNRAA